MPHIVILSRVAQLDGLCHTLSEGIGNNQWSGEQLALAQALLGEGETLANQMDAAYANEIDTWASDTETFLGI